MLLGKNLKQLLEDKELTPTQLSKMSSVPRTTILGWLGANSSSPNLDQLLKVADSLGVTLDYLVAGRSDEPDVDKLLEKISLHSGLYEINISRVKKK